MKKIVLILLLVSVSAFAQKGKKSTPKKSATSTSVSASSSSTDGFTVKNEGNTIYIISASNKTLIKKTENSNANITNLSIKSFTASGNKLYLISWAEKSLTKTALKEELTTSTINQIWNLETNSMIIENTEFSTMITEKVFLDKNKTVSETQQRVRRGGFGFELASNGDILLKNKSSQDYYSFDKDKQQYIFKSSAKK